MMSATECKQMETCHKLEEVLNAYYGGGYRIQWNAGESCLTFFYHNGELYKQVPDSEMVGDLNVHDFVHVQNDLWWF